MRFNPRPPPERGATANAYFLLDRRTFVFQSTPPSGERSDHRHSFGNDSSHGFNPRPPPERGATQRLASGQRRRRFQSTPPSGERSDTARHTRRVFPVLFQSTPPSGERSDYRWTHHRTWFRTFQSTPPSGERSDQQLDQVQRLLGGFNPRPPPERGATVAVVGIAVVAEVSIHAPLRREERQSNQAATASCNAVRDCFNPRPPPERGAT